MSESDAFDKVQPWQERAGAAGRITRGLRPVETGFAPAQRKEREKLAAQAASYQPNPAYDRLLEWKKADDPRWDTLDARTRISLGFYEQAKAAAKEVDRRDR